MAKRCLLNRNDGAESDVISSVQIPFDRLTSVSTIPNNACLQVAHEIKSNDVLCGRTSTCYSNLGNKKFRRIIENYRERYQTAHSRKTKTSITNQVMEMVLSSGGRFLRLDNTTGMWVNVDNDNFVYEKVSHALRDAKDPKRSSIPTRKSSPSNNLSFEQEATYQATLADQQQIFQLLLKLHPEQNVCPKVKQIDNVMSQLQQYHLQQEIEQEEDPLDSFDFVYP